MRNVTLNQRAIDDRCRFLGIASNAELARRTGIDRAHLGRVLAGQRPANAAMAKRIADALGVSLMAILSPDPEAAAEIEAEVGRVGA